MILDSTYFNGELFLPMVKYSDPVGIADLAMQSVAEQNLDWFIAKYEREFLIKLLGNKLAYAFTHYLDSDETTSEWILRNGYWQIGKWVESGVWRTDTTKMWEDLKKELYFSVGKFAYSPAANYVYFFVMKDAMTQTMARGEIIGEQSYSKLASSNHKMIKAWNDMCAMIRNVECFLRENKDTYSVYLDTHKDCQFGLINEFGL